jgi:DNA-directed RNA polymerase subunit L
MELPTVQIPQFRNIREEHSILHVTISNIDVSFINGLRRTILSDINVCHIDSDNCTIIKNTGHMHNELLKERLLNIPIHVDYDKLEEFVQQYTLDINVLNKGDSVLYVTTKDFIIRTKSTNEVLPIHIQNTLFPPNAITNDYIDFAKVYPGQSIIIHATFAINNMKYNGAFNVVSLCTFMNTQDTALIQSTWDIMEREQIALMTTVENIAFIKNNFFSLDAERIIIPNSYDFSTESIVYPNKIVVQLACSVLISKCQKYIINQENNKDVVRIQLSPVLMENSYDIILINETDTMGNILSHLLYQYLCKDTDYLNYCGFCRFHPHDVDSTIRIAFKEKKEYDIVQHNCRILLSNAAKYSLTIFQQISDYIGYV